MCQISISNLLSCMYLCYVCILSHVLGFGFVTFQNEDAVVKLCNIRFVQILGKTVLFISLYYIINFYVMSTFVSE